MSFVKGRNTVGLILRTFAPKPGLVKERVEQIEKMLEAAVGVEVFHRVDILVWADERYDGSDCGETAPVLQRLKIGYTSRFDVSVSEIKAGDVFCGTLNYGIAKQLRHSIDYSLIASSETATYFTQSNIGPMLEAASNGARAIGLAITELTDSIIAGRIANTFALWHNESLMQVGGFDLRAAKPMSTETAMYLRGWSKTSGEVFYPLAGVEEIIPLVRMVDTFGQCIAPVLPVSAEGAYKVPDPKLDPEGYARHQKKMGTKFERQAALAASVGADLSYISGGVMPAYRH